MGRPRQIQIDTDKATKLKKRLGTIAKNPPPSPQVTLDHFIEENFELWEAASAGADWKVLAEETSKVTGQTITEDRLISAFNRVKKKKQAKIQENN